MAWTIAAGFFYMLALTAPLLKLGLYGGFRAGMIGTGPFILDDQGYWMLASVVFVTTILAPFLKIAGTFTVLVALAF